MSREIVEIGMADDSIPEERQRLPAPRLAAPRRT